MVFSYPLTFSAVSGFNSAHVFLELLLAAEKAYSWRELAPIRMSVVFSNFTSVHVSLMYPYMEVWDYNGWWFYVAPLLAAMRSVSFSGATDLYRSFSRNIFAWLAMHSMYSSISSSALFLLSMGNCRLLIINVTWFKSNVVLIIVYWILLIWNFIL